VKLVREHINEKFTEDSDPINDMGIGIAELMKRDYEKIRGLSLFEMSEILFGNKDYPRESFFILRLIKACIKNNNFSINFIYKLFIYEVRYLGEEREYEKGLIKHLKDLYDLNFSLHEKFMENSDPITDMGIGIIHQIEEWITNNTPYDIRDKQDYIWICAKYGKTKFVEYLIKAGVDVHEGNDLAIRRAVQNDHVEIVKLLLDAGAKKEFDDIYTYPSGYLFLIARSEKMLKLLKKYIK